MLKRLLIVVILLALSSTLSVFGAEKEKTVTRADVAAILSATAFAQKRAGDLLSWTIGYDESKMNKPTVVPVIKEIKIVPESIPPDGRTKFRLTCAISDPEGLPNIKIVRADLRSIGRLPTMVLVDNGQFGDEVANDGIFTLLSSVIPGISPGRKEISVSVINKKGWFTLSKANVEVTINPKILDISIYPEEVKIGEDVVLFATIDSPGDIKDVEAYANLSDIGGGNNIKMYNDGTHGDAFAGDKTFTLEFRIPQIPTGEKRILIYASNALGGKASAEKIIKVRK